jgi:pimeloyl-ACP methyl ester carboxylesterase
VSYPILLLPGLGSSRLVLNNRVIFPPDISFYLLNYDEWANNIINNKNMTTYDFGDPVGIDLKYYKNSFKKLLTNPNIHPIPYDFRLIHDKDYIENFNYRLEKYIELMNEPVILLTHSTGGLIGHWFLYNKPQEWKDKHVKLIANVNVPFAGSIMPLYECTQKTWANFIIGKNIIKSLGAIVINLPNRKYIGPILFVNGQEHTNYFKYFDELHKLEEIYNNNYHLIDSFSKSNGVNTIIVYTLDKKTPTVIDINDNRIQFINGPGDGIVPMKSLLHPKKWKQNNIKFYHISNSEHSCILNSDELIKIINDNADHF